MKTSINVIVVEDQAVVRQGLIAILSYRDDIEVVGEAENGVEAVKLVKKLKPDVILLDLIMPVQDGLETIPKILEIAPASRILVVTGFGEADKVFNAIKSGALGYLLKDSSHEKLVSAIHDVYRGKAFIPPSMALRMIREMDGLSASSDKQSPLTKRELETLRYIAQGLTNLEISKKLVVHERTIAKYVSNILSKLHLANRTQAALYALRTGLSELDEE
ncbi:MAG: response regulator transcription factor [Anaerolineae bacterium]|jgi:NarL family two-component system response regulator LiaR|nr:response regulator transcription factor [Anaerolineae bacterium]MBT3713933.1 response regulator transcription factor [Anaerolineae bacterium]MBT4311794.1 response regulator transcription factor [Anaerolineae bacterium]MBT4458930.1 response regulator transcription factor [Anaerolineae bacterium]MBT6060072.1 response regulator transcription factor [Anaerolineae bacterium]